MAKGKHAAALFEVIHASRKQSRSDKAGLLRTPTWWFKSRKRTEGENPAPAPETAPVAPAPAQTTDNSAAADPAAKPAAAPAAPAVVPAAPAAAPHAAPVDPPMSAADPTRKPAVDVLLDPERHQITLRVTYASAIVTAFSILVVVVLAYVVGRSMSRGPAPALAGATSEQLRTGPARSEVLNVGPGGATPRAPAPGAVQHPPIDIARPGVTATTPAGRRVNGLNYVIIQGYPDEASAKAAVDALRENGVSSTIEKGLRGLRSDWFIVVGTEGFTRISGPEYAAYVKQIQTISDKFAGSRRSFKAFEPMPYKWDRP